MIDFQILRTPPKYCHYADGPCDQDFLNIGESTGVFLYPALPENQAHTIESAVEHLNLQQPNSLWTTWREFQTTGQIIFCSICRHMRFSGTIIADVTTLNFNLMFEIGFALGLELPLILIRDTSFMRDKGEFRKLGILETIGYIDFQNSAGLCNSIRSALPVTAIPNPSSELNKSVPLYLIKSHLSTEGQVRLTSIIEQSSLNFRSYDPNEDPPLSLHDSRKQVAASFGVIGHLLMHDRRDAIIHNARCALIAGMAAAAGKVVVLFQEGESLQPIDYRDLVYPYTNAAQLDSALERPIRRIQDRVLDSGVVPLRPPQSLLENLDLGDIAAENEVQKLSRYFIPTGQYNEARRGHARLIIGRKGSGKTAIFYAIRDSVPKAASHLVLDMKPEGHQFTKLREGVLSRLSQGLQEHTLTAFWTFILLCELCRKVIDNDESWAQRDTRRFESFLELSRQFRDLVPSDSGDFSERLLNQVDRLSQRIISMRDFTPAQTTELLFSTEIPILERVVADYLAHKSEVWMLLDNIDKGWPTRGAQPEDVLIIGALLDASRKIQQRFENHGLPMYCLVFLRNDIYELFVRQTSDRDKETPVVLDWSDREAFKELVLRRIVAATDLEGSFEEVWSKAFERNVGTRDSFGFVVDRTLMRPRDLIRFLRKAVEVAVNRGNEVVREDDFLEADNAYSEDMLSSINYELSDVSASFEDLVYCFIGCRTVMAVEEVRKIVNQMISAKECDRALQLLIWFGFLGVSTLGSSGQVFAYNVRYNLAKINFILKSGQAQLVVHPAFRTSLGCR